MTLKKMTTKLTIPKDVLTDWKKLTKSEKEKTIFKKEISLFRSRGKSNDEIADFYNCSSQTISNYFNEARKEGLKIYQKNRVWLIEDQLLDLDALIEQSKSDLEQETDKEIKIKLRKEISDTLTKKAKLQWLLVENVQVNNVWNPTEMLLQQFNIFKPNNNVNSTQQKSWE